MKPGIRPCLEELVREFAKIRTQNDDKKYLFFVELKGMLGTSGNNLFFVWWLILTLIYQLCEICVRFIILSQVITICLHRNKHVNFESEGSCSESLWCTQPGSKWTLIKFYNSAVINIGKLPPHKRPKFGVAKQVIQKIVQVEKSEHQ